MKTEQQWVVVKVGMLPRWDDAREALAHRYPAFRAATRHQILTNNGRPEPGTSMK